MFIKSFILWTESLSVESNRNRLSSLWKERESVKKRIYLPQQTIVVIVDIMSCCFSCCASLACGLCTSTASCISQKSARIGYCGLFGASLVVSWILREVGAPLLEKFPCTFHSFYKSFNFHLNFPLGVFVFVTVQEGLNGSLLLHIHALAFSELEFILLRRNDSNILSYTISIITWNLLEIS